MTSVLSLYDASNVSVLKWIDVLSRGDPHIKTSGMLVENLNEPVTWDQSGSGSSVVWLLMTAFFLLFLRLHSKRYLYGIKYCHYVLNTSSEMQLWLWKATTVHHVFVDIKWSSSCPSGTEGCDQRFSLLSIRNRLLVRSLRLPRCFCINHCPPSSLWSASNKAVTFTKQHFLFCAAAVSGFFEQSFLSLSFLSDLWCTSHLLTF